MTIFLIEEAMNFFNLTLRMKMTAPLKKRKKTIDIFILVLYN